MGGEETIFPRDVIEKALWHVIGNKTEQSYDRGDLFQKRRRLMEAWADFCGGAGEHDNLLELEARRKAGAKAREYRPYDAADRKLFPKLERLMKSKGVSLWPPHLALPKRAKSLAAAPWRAAPNGCAKFIAATGKPKKSNKRPGGTGGLQLLDSQKTR